MAYPGMAMRAFAEKPNVRLHAVRAMHLINETSVLAISSCPGIFDANVNAQGLSPSLSLIPWIDRLLPKCHHSGGGNQYCNTCAQTSVAADNHKQNW